MGLQRWVDVPMPELEPAPAERLRLPRSAARGTGEIRYIKHTGKGPAHRCDDCMELYAEHHGGNGPLPPAARQAKFERRQGGASRLLCVEHKQLRQELEARR